ncbi:MAG: hypothetical protein MJY59_02290 [Bacteroidaceae bacterium]|nr:hypothetical protein [Bacteroidaceae bacterium]
MRRTTILLSVMMVLISSQAQTWEEPVVPGEDIKTTKSSVTGYLWNIDADAFLINGMNSNTSACATRLTNGDAAISTPQRCVLWANDSTVKMRLKDYNTYYVACPTDGKNDIAINKTINAAFGYTETAPGSHIYTLRNVKFGLLLDTSWEKGGHLTLTEGAGNTHWVFIKEANITNGSYARYKSARALYDIYKAVEVSDCLGDFSNEIAAAYNVYSDPQSTNEELTAAAKTLFAAVYGCLTVPVDVSFMLQNADMTGSGSMTGWATDNPAFSWSEFEKYHVAYSFEQDCTLPMGIYDIGLRSLFRQDGSDAAPNLTVKATKTVKANIPNMNSIDFGVTNSSSNNWTKGTTYFVPNGMQSGGQGLTHTEAVAWCRDVAVSSNGTVNIKMNMTSTSQWLNWQDVTLLYKGVDVAELRTALQSLYDDAVSLYGDGTGKKAAELKQAIDAAKAVIDDGSAPSGSLSKAIKAIQSAINDYRNANASVDNPIDKTSLITNNSFERQFQGWTSKNMQAQTNSSFTLKQGTTYLEKWTSKGGYVGDAEVSQTIPELGMGIYQLKVAAQNIQEDSPSKKQDGACIFANAERTDVNARAQYTLTFTNIEKEVTVGFLAEGAKGNWIACDNFRLYYVGGTTDDFRTALKSYIDRAKSLSSQKMHTSVLSLMDAAIKAAEAEYQKEETENYPSVAKALRLACEEAEISISAFAALLTAIQEAETTYGDGSLPGAPAFLEAINKAKAVYEDSSSDFDSLSSQITALAEAQLAYLVSAPTGPVPTVTTDTRTLRGSVMAFGRMTYRLNNAKLLESGFCYSTEHDPDIFSQRSTRWHDNNGRIYIMDGMKPSTVYYVRPYVITQGYQVAYGDELKVITLPKGTMTWSYNGGGDDATNERISSSCAHGIDIWNSLMSVKGFHLTANYSPGTPTADCSYGGWMRVGENASYQRTGTMLHEAAHGVGVGTQNGWWTMLINGVWTGDRANKVLQFWDNDKTAKLHGDSQHMWPYGINGAHEDNGSDMLYYAQALIIQGLHEDGVSPTSGCFASAGYTFEQDDSVKYYIKNESNSFGLTTSYLTVSSTALRWKQASLSDIVTDDAYAWYLTFDPVTQFYTFRNAATGMYITYNGGFKTVNKTGAITASEKFQLMRGRTDVTVGTGSGKSSYRGYWILKANGGSATAMSGAANGNVGAQSFDLGTGASSQRWLILTEAEAQKFDKATDIQQTRTDTPTAPDTYFNLSGQQVRSDYKGIIIHNGKKMLRQ